MLLSSLMTLCCEPLINRMAFFPDQTYYINSLPERTQEIFVSTNDGIKIHSLFFPASDSKKIVIYFHGNAGNIYHRIPFLTKINEFGVNVLGIDYRGYGKSEGKPSESGIYKDGIAALKYACDSLCFQQSDVFLLGRSIGSTVAINTAIKKQIAGLILIAPLSSAKDHARANGFGVLSGLAGKAFDNLSKMKQILCPVLIIHGTDDEVIPFWMGKKLYDTLQTQKEYFEIKKGKHNDLEYTNPHLFWNKIHKFISQ